MVFVATTQLAYCSTKSARHSQYVKAHAWLCSIKHVSKVMVGLNLLMPTCALLTKAIQQYFLQGVENSSLELKKKKALKEQDTHIVHNRMGKTRDLFRKIGDTKGTFHAKMGSIKDRNGMVLTKAEDIKKRWQEYTEELYKKDLHDPDNHDGMITHLWPDILECEVEWALGSITMNKASGGDGIPVELFQILKDDAVKVLHSICQQIWKTQQWPQD